MDDSRQAGSHLHRCRKCTLYGCAFEPVYRDILYKLKRDWLHRRTGGRRPCGQPGGGRPVRLAGGVSRSASCHIPAICTGNDPAPAQPCVEPASAWSDTCADMRRLHCCASLGGGSLGSMPLSNPRSARPPCDLAPCDPDAHPPVAECPTAASVCSKNHPTWKDHGKPPRIKKPARTNRAGDVFGSLGIRLQP